MLEGLGFLFDLDGVIVDSMPLHIEAWERYLENHGLDSAEISRRMHGRRNDEIVAHYFGTGLDPDVVFEHGAAKERLFRQLMGEQLAAHIVPGAPEFLDRYAHVPKALGSNAEPLNVEFVLMGAGLKRHFPVIVDGHQVERAKPHPDIYLKAAQLIGVDPRNCIVFEDSPTGIQAAKGAGAMIVAIRTHPGDLPAVDLAVDDFRDPALDEWLKARTLRV